MSKYGILAGMAALSSAPAMAQSAPVTFESDIEAVTIVGLAGSNSSEAEFEPLLYELSLDNRVEKVLENGLQVSGRLTIRGQRDNPARPSFRGRFDGLNAQEGGYSGLSGGPGELNAGARGRTEAAYIELDGGYGELRVGRDRGIAARFHEGAPSVLSHSGINNPYLDPAGLKILRTNHDLTGPSAKVSYASPRILGLRAGVSYTPDAEADGLDRSVEAGRMGPDLSNAVEAGLNLSRRLRNPDVRIEAALGWSSAEANSPLPGVREKAETFSAGAALEFEAFEIGASWLSSDNGFASGDYRAWEVGLRKNFGETGISFNYGEAEDDLAGLDSRAYSIGAARDIADNLSLAVAYQDETLDTVAGTLEGAGIVVEITLSADFLEISAF
ncbi:porin [Henriciella sp.]|uniref:porin n=1 Tax=Henriciella sp. TaxID=1968823 RepID=UPI002635039A|nr:porin [Henriciella sp.]